MICERNEGTEVLAGVRAAMRATTRDIADEVTTPFRFEDLSFGEYP